MRRPIILKAFGLMFESSAAVSAGRARRAAVGGHEGGRPARLAEPGPRSDTCMNGPSGKALALCEFSSGSARLGSARCAASSARRGRRAGVSAAEPGRRADAARVGARDRFRAERRGGPGRSGGAWVGGARRRLCGGGAQRALRARRAAARVGAHVALGETQLGWALGLF